MARALRIQFPDAFYHVTCRGNERRQIFFNDDDRHRFITLLAESLDIFQVVLHAYVLMPNHFHILIQTLRANMSEFMRRFNICYTGWFNHRHGRCGHLYQGRYHSFLIDADAYLLEVSRYLHLNIARSKPFHSSHYREQWRRAKEYRWSSLPGYLDKKRIVRFVNYDVILSMAGGRQGYRDYVTDGLKTGMKNPFEELKHQIILGDDNFVKRVKSTHLKCGSSREQPSYRRLVAELFDPEHLLDIVAQELSVERGELSMRLGSGIARGIAAELLYRHSGLSEKEIGKFLGGIDYCSVSQLRRRLKEKMVHDETIRDRYAKAERKIRKLSSVKI